MAENPGIRRLAAALQAPYERAALRKALFHTDLERALLTPGWSLKQRMKALGQLLELDPPASWPAKAIEETRAELTRLGMRMLSAAGYFADPPEPAMPAVEQAEGLLQLAVARILPRGALLEAALLRAQRLLTTPAARESLEADAGLRQRFVALMSGG